MRVSTTLSPFISVSNKVTHYELLFDLTFYGQNSVWKILLRAWIIGMYMLQWHHSQHCSKSLFVRDLNLNHLSRHKCRKIIFCYWTKKKVFKTFNGIFRIPNRKKREIKLKGVVYPFLPWEWQNRRNICARFLHVLKIMKGTNFMICTFLFMKMQKQFVWSSIDLWRCHIEMFKKRDCIKRGSMPFWILKTEYCI